MVFVCSQWDLLHEAHLCCADTPPLWAFLCLHLLFPMSGSLEFTVCGLSVSRKDRAQPKARLETPEGLWTGTVWLLAIQAQQGVAGWPAS